MKILISKNSVLSSWLWKLIIHVSQYFTNWLWKLFEDYVNVTAAFYAAIFSNHQFIRVAFYDYSLDHRSLVFIFFFKGTCLLRRTSTGKNVFSDNFLNVVVEAFINCIIISDRKWLDRFLGTGCCSRRYLTLVTYDNVREVGPNMCLDYWYTSERSSSRSQFSSNHLSIVNNMGK